MNRFLRSAPTVLALIAILLLNSWPVAPLRAQVPQPQPQAAASPAQNSQRAYLPLVIRPTGPPNFTLSSPLAGSTVGGTTLVVAQVLDAGSVSSVSFRAGNLDLGTDSTPADGFRAFLDASRLPAGSVTITATARGPAGEASQSVEVIAQPNPPASATIGSQGGVLGSDSGATITIPPGTVSDNTTVSIRERTQAQVTTESGIVWDDIGVTFLGDIAIQSNQPLSRPVEISTQGFANRIQPGQAVVTYNLLPDQDGDGIGELVVASTAEVAPNGAIVSTPVNNTAVIRSATVRNASGRTTLLTRDNRVVVAPGELLTVITEGLNAVSLQGNVLTFRSATGKSYSIAALILPTQANPLQQELKTLLPSLPPGDVTISLFDASSGTTIEVGLVTITTAPALTRPASEIIEAYYAQHLIFLSSLPTVTPEAVEERDSLVSATTQMRDAFRQLFTLSDPQVQGGLVEFATIIEGSGVLKSEGAQQRELLMLAANGCFTPEERQRLQDDFDNAIIVGTVACTIFTAIAAAAGGVPGVIVGSICAGALITGDKKLNRAIDRAPTCPNESPPPPPLPPCQPTPSGGVPSSRGIGGAPPPGGNGCGNAAGSGGGTAALAQVGSGSLQGRYIVKVFPQAGGRALSPFTGATDAGGYFFLPFIPQGEPFRAVAVDTVTGASRSFEGVGPATGESAYMFFDFLDAEDNRVAINIGDTVSDGEPQAGAGNIENPGAFDVYTFEAEPDREVIFEVLNKAAGLSQTRWKLVSPTGTEVFNRVMATTQLIALPEPGTYTLTVGDDTSGGTGTYSFKLVGIPLPDRFNIAIGDTVAPGIPGPGAGTIEQSLVKDRYTFTATAGQRIFFDAISNSVSYFRLNWTLLDPNGNRVGSVNSFVDTDPITLVAAGSYTIVIDADADLVPTYSFKLWDVPPPQQFNIAIGATVANGIPAAGAGNIETPGVIDRYTFTATAGQRIFFDAISNSVSYFRLSWTLLDPNGNPVGNENSFDDTDPITLVTAGSYTIVIDADTDLVPTYSFKLWDVPAPQQFAIAIGDTVANGIPAAGAGNIETPGVIDRYTFTATAGQRIFFDAISNSVSFTQLSWTLLDPNGNQVGNENYFADIDPITLVAAGSYTIVIDADGDRVPTYSFKLWDVPPPQQFTIAIGDTVADGVPAAGAGNIETPGVIDRYTFTATAGQRIFFDAISNSVSFTQLSWTLLDPNGNQVGNENYFADIDPITLVAAGSYTIVIDADGDRVPTYSFKLWDVPPPQQFTIAIGDTVADGVPAAGAGNIETPGVVDRYTFTATAGQAIFFDAITPTSSSLLRWSLRDPNGNLVGSQSRRFADTDPITLNLAGSYTLEVTAEGDRTLVYSFRLEPR
ncbi:hypothetical protein EYB53_020590 [Candidatus Chloroploca sp. M-50]|uniref:Uncharacterized protein n=1 Tax=Candidatus Chloroploca mongolica TaxID=2528176 RepID=A0ABS4DFA6_9CHLR|nr:Ig-like domain-containing protein [Candidatus Chloroploca mongolica]MBP1468123.1 hypothetical protein [Candidatus Chloroploca mongolica]